MSPQDGGAGLTTEELARANVGLSQCSVAFRKPIAEYQLVQSMLADRKVDIEAARTLILQTARKRDAGEDVTMNVSVCKYYATGACRRVADKVVQIFGGQGWVKERCMNEPDSPAQHRAAAAARCWVSERWFGKNSNNGRKFHG